MDGVHHIIKVCIDKIRPSQIRFLQIAAREITVLKFPTVSKFQ